MSCSSTEFFHALVVWHVWNGLLSQYGFNRQSVGLYAKDMVKSLVLKAVLGLPLVAAIIALVQWGGEYFFLYVFALIAIFQLIMTVVFPNVIMPWFYKFEPLQEGALRTKVEKLAVQLEFPLSDLYVMDGSSRSAHSNAFFTGACPAVAQRRQSVVCRVLPAA